MSSEVAISARGLGKAYKIYDRPSDRLKQMVWRGRRNFYREFWALRDVDFDVCRGETLGIIGPNGAGKSTLLQMVCGTVEPSEGTVAVHGRVAALLSLGAGFNPEFTGRENVFVNAAVLGLTQSQIRARFDAIAAFADIGSFIDQPVRTYSSGMYVRLAFAVATSVQPDILIVDEALAVGDIRFQAKCIHRIRQMLADGTTLLFVSHDPDTVRSLCQRGLWLENGRPKMLGEARVVSERYLTEARLAHNAQVLQQRETPAAKPAEPAPESVPAASAGAPPEVPAAATEQEAAAQAAPPPAAAGAVAGPDGPPQEAAASPEGAVVSRIETLDGADLVRVEHVRLLNERGEPTEHLHPQERFTVEIGLAGLQDLDHVSVGLVIKDRLGLDLTGESVFNRFGRGFRLARGQQVRACFSAVNNLRDGQYSIEVIVNQVSRWDRSDNLVLYTNPVAVAFRVLRDPEHPMWFRFRHEFEVSVT